MTTTRLSAGEQSLRTNVNIGAHTGSSQAMQLTSDAIAKL